MAASRDRTGDRGSLATRYRVWRAGLQGGDIRFERPPEPRSIGSAALGRQICEGKVLLGGRRLELGEADLWSLPLADPRAEADRHGFAWLDDLAAVGTRRAGELQRAWLVDWLNRFAGGRGPGWAPHVVGRRLIRWINHGAALMDGLDPADDLRFRKALGGQIVYLSRYWSEAAPGPERFEALAGLIISGLAVARMQPRMRPALAALERACKTEIGADGGLATRNPESLLDLFANLVWCEEALDAAGLATQPEHRAAIARIAPTLRSLRHADGTLARFQGGGRGVEGRLDGALAAARVRTPAHTGLAMGYARLARGRTTVLLDAAPPPQGPHGAAAHASTLAFEMTAGRRPLIVSCGAGAPFGGDWDRAARATPAHSALCPDGASSAGFAPAPDGRLLLVDGPRDVRCEPAPERGPASLSAAHDGFAASHGLVHVRRLDLGEDGARLAGEDVLTAVSAAERARFSALAEARGAYGIGFTVRFHLHPDVAAIPVDGGAEISLLLKSGEVWVFRNASSARIRLDPSVYLEKTRPQPTPTRQIVLEARAVDFATTLRWSLTRAQAGRAPFRDLFRDGQSIT